MKVYHLPDLDGLTEAIVAADRIEAAAASLGMTARQMRERGWRAVKGAKAAPALQQPGQPLYRPVLGARGVWRHEREAARASAARAALRERRRPGPERGRAPARSNSGEREWARMHATIGSERLASSN